MKKIDYLEGLRGICCFIVIIDHCINSYKPDLRFTGLSDFGGELRRIIAWTPLNFIYSGIAPVCIFFILSGFVLSLKFNKTQEREYILSGVIKRYPRLIIPVFCSMLFMYVVYFILSHYTEQDMNMSLSTAIVQALYLAPFEHTNLFNYALWTISFEIYGSFLVFSLLAIFGNYKNKYYFYIGVFIFLYLNNSFYSLFVFGVILSDLYVNNKYKSSTWARLVTFIIGICLVTTPYQREGVELNRGLYSYLSFFDNIDYKTLYQSCMLTGSMLLFYSICGSEFAQKFLDIKVFRYLGKISFPLYVLHASILTVIAWLLHNIIEQITIADFCIAFIITVCICFVLSSLFEKYIDVPAIKLSNKLSKKLNGKHF
ncbi:acyltransferase family protein [Klebsiella aerogenes]|uniref:acyltransferase family protein n=1 Tax=Klebsiella aerogenes TaxID=548 RepID=UPI0005F08B9B|nr:acyltransferase [Klebsiella aerogenes]KJO57139.1 acetyltransferase [Klebsiella aerogenes]MBK0465962.1 acyltransferase [Klebsiella aerogenes]MBK0697531.1 acyltransferase [Klebsiella aerogenes]UNX75354.1 acyltransferase [Klebsiella aerogenes]HBX2115238.1 acyltransferase [Klebsiella aerogenes]